MLRAVASVVVMLWHVQPLRGTLFSFGGLAVDLFFMISGVVVTAAYEARLRSGLTVSRFAVLRLVRLYPMYAIGSALGLAVLLAGIWQGGFAAWKVRELLPFVLAATMLLPFPSAPTTPSFRLNPPAWSLFFELVANAAHAVLLPVLTDRVLVGVLIGCALAIVAIQLATGAVAFGDSGWQMFLGLPRVAFPYTLGVVFARLHAQRRLPRLRTPFLALPLAFLAMTAVPATLVPLVVTGDLAIFVVFPLIVAAALQQEPPAWLLGVARSGERLSYPLYMVHFPLLMTAELGIRRGWWPTRPGFAVALAAAVVIAWTAERYVDAPLRKRLGARLRTRPAVATGDDSVTFGC